MLAAAAALCLFIGIAHSYLGERYILIRLLRRQDLPKTFGSDVFTKRTLRFAWHLTSVAWWGLGAVVLALGASSPRDAMLAVSATFGMSAAVTFVGSRGRHLAWVVFLLIALLCWAA